MSKNIIALICPNCEYTMSRYDDDRSDVLDFVEADMNITCPHCNNTALFSQWSYQEKK